MCSAIWPKVNAEAMIAVCNTVDDKCLWQFKGKRALNYEAKPKTGLAGDSATIDGGPFSRRCASVPSGFVLCT